MQQCKVGAGLRSAHYAHVLSHPKIFVSWFEAISENYMDSQGRPLQVLESIRKNYPVALHGVSMSLGSARGLRRDYLQKLQHLVRLIDPIIVSDHLCWTANAQHNLHDLLPLPFTKEALDTVCSNIACAQELLGRKILVENVSSYLSFKQSTMSECEFLVEVAKRSGCGILLDVNNVYVNAVNHGFDARHYIESIPKELIGQIHLAGHKDLGTHLFDTHSCAVAPPVWELYRQAVQGLENVLVCIEWDEDIPEFSVLEKEALLASEIWSQVHAR